MTPRGPSKKTVEDRKPSLVLLPGDATEEEIKAAVRVLFGLPDDYEFNLDDEDDDDDEDRPENEF